MLNDSVSEVIFVGLPGLTHHYSGLSPDNVASGLNRGTQASPKQAALQVIELIRLLKGLGLDVGILPPQLRPHLGLLHQHFTGEADAIISQAALAAPALLEKASSASAMWTANAATVTPSADTSDHMLHITAANLFTNLHRRIEAEDTYRVLKAIFAGVLDCQVHPPLPAAAGLYDEGAANHMRLSPTHADTGLHIFVYGADGSQRDPPSARQNLLASQAIKTQHHIPDKQSLFIRQNAEVIRQGVFHNDVIGVSNGPVLLAHERAYAKGLSAIDDIAQAYKALHPGREPVLLIIREEDLSVEEAVHTYVFNSQIVTKPDGAMAMIAPTEVQTLYEGKAAALMEKIRADAANPIDEIVYADLRQSMRNGGGPACLRLRVPMTKAQLSAVRREVRVIADDVLLAAIIKLVEKHYPDELWPQDLADATLYHRCHKMLEELSGIMRLPLV